MVKKIGDHDDPGGRGELTPGLSSRENRESLFATHDKICKF